MASQVELCNLAIRDLGGNSISQITENTKEAKLCNDYWNELVDELLEEYCWDFAKVWVALALDATYVFVDDRYLYAYALPSNYIKMSDTELGYNYEIRGQHIVTNEEDAEIEYIQRMTDVTKWPVHFRKAFVSLLRSRIAFGLARKGTDPKEWVLKYEQLDLPAAKTKDAQTGRPSKEVSRSHTDSTDTWLSKRPSS